MPPKKNKKSVQQGVYGLAVRNMPGYFLLISLIISLIGLYIVLERFVTVVILASILAIAFYPVYKRILAWFRYKSALASLVSCLLVILIIVIPISLLILLLVREAYDTYLLIEAKVAAGYFDNLLKWENGGALFDLKEKLLPVVDLDTLDIKKTITSTAQSVSTFLVAQTAIFLKKFTTFLIDFVVMMFVLFYLFRDGQLLKKRLMDYSPLPPQYEKKIIKKMKDMVGAIVYGLFLTALTQGTLGGIGFAIAGISNPIFWGAVISFFALIPLVGTSVVWGPAGLILIFTGSVGWGVFVLLWGFFVVGLVDNFMKPYLIGGKAHTYPLLTFLSIFGGIFAFGLQGILFGPIIMMFAVTILYIYKSEYRPVLREWDGDK